MSIMNDETNEKCPLCAEVMDLTDKELKPCNCGYEICVWCWNHIMEMAENDGSGGRCPACRALYERDRILKTKISSERLKKMHLQKQSLRRQPSNIDKQKAPERVIDPFQARLIQRRLVYIIGLPVSLACEEILKKKTFFGQYGKIEGIITDNFGANDQFPDTCRAFVKFSKEAEALSCIQVVNGFTLNGRTLKATIGFTRYCHLWLSNKVCKKTNCTFIHYEALPEDVCTKEEVPLICARILQSVCIPSEERTIRSGSTLPPPWDNRSAKKLITTADNTSNPWGSASTAASYISHSADSKTSSSPPVRDLNGSWRSSIPASSSSQRPNDLGNKASTGSAFTVLKLKATTEGKENNCSAPASGDSNLSWRTAVNSTSLRQLNDTATKESSAQSSSVVANAQSKPAQDSPHSTSARQGSSLSWQSSGSDSSSTERSNDAAVRKMPDRSTPVVPHQILQRPNGTVVIQKTAVSTREVPSTEQSNKLSTPTVPQVLQHGHNSTTKVQKPTVPIGVAPSAKQPERSSSSGSGKAPLPMPANLNTSGVLRQSSAAPREVYSDKHIDGIIKTVPAAGEVYKDKHIDKPVSTVPAAEMYSKQHVDALAMQLAQIFCTGSPSAQSSTPSNLPQGIPRATAPQRTITRQPFSDADTSDIVKWVSECLEENPDTGPRLWTRPQFVPGAPTRQNDPVLALRSATVRPLHLAIVPGSNAPPGYSGPPGYAAPRAAHQGSRFGSTSGNYTLF